MQYKSKVLDIEKYVDDKLEFEVFRTEKPFNFNPGNYVVLGIDGFMDPANPSKLKLGYYSIASSPDQEYLEFCAKIKTEPGFSSYLGEHLEIGAEMIIDGPHEGKLTLNKEAKENVFVAIGSAIAPVMSFIRHLICTNDQRPMRLFYGFRNRKQCLYGKELENMHGLDLHTIASQEQGHVQDLLRDYEFSREEDVYVCGNESMKNDVKFIMERKGFTDKQIHMS